MTDRVQPPRTLDTYEQTYADALRFFRYIHQAPNPVECGAFPLVYQPLVWYLGGITDEPGSGTRREDIEAACARRPEMVDALWRADMVDMGTTRHVEERRFIIATYSGFFRPEILAHMRYVDAYAQQGDRTRLVLGPCSALKPYPSPTHSAIIRAVGDKADLAVLSTAVGVTPRHCWGNMPEYDNGLPYFERIYERLPEYISRTTYTEVFLYLDILAHDAMKALRGVTNRYGQAVKVRDVLPPRRPRHPDYLPLHEGWYLGRLASCF